VASSDYIDNGTDLTDAVVKAASASGEGLTSEHVRRVCEMTYHNTYERLHRSATSADRYVSFDPPDPIKAAEALRAEKVASFNSEGTMSFDRFYEEMEKEASAPSLAKFTPTNAFSALVDATPEDMSKIAWHDPSSEVRKLHSDLGEAVSAIVAEIASTDSEEKIATLELAKRAQASYREGFSVEDILHACLSGADWDSHTKSAAAEVASEIATRLYSDVEKVAGLKENKSSCFGDINPEHPLPASFSKVARLRGERAHLEIALSDLRSDRARLDREIRAIYE
tara:strand:+ start:1423 stop:2271 length:849 start_codon:yes stop_codon:yes gene_type:complete